MKLRYWINGAIIAVSAMIASASAAPISTMNGIARTDALAVTKVAQRRHYAAHKTRQVRRFYGAATLGDPTPADWHWHPLDSNDIPFGSAQWWQQHPSGGGGK
jgi:hypothetical protein